MIKPLLSSYNNFVSPSSLEDLYRSTLHWAEQHCTLGDLRPGTVIFRVLFVSKYYLISIAIITKIVKNMIASYFI